MVEFNRRAPVLVAEMSQFHHLYSSNHIQLSVTSPVMRPGGVLLRRSTWKGAWDGVGSHSDSARGGRTFIMSSSHTIPLPLLPSSAFPRLRSALFFFSTSSPHSSFNPTPRLSSPKPPRYPSDAYSGPYFTAFPSLTTALKSNTSIFTKSRACTVVPNFVGLKFMVHNGKDYLPVQVTEEMVGHKLGEFSPTRKKFSYR